VFPPLGLSPETFHREGCYGYRYGEVPLPILPPIKIDCEIRKTNAPEFPAVRPMVQVSLGCHVEGYALPHPCPLHRDTMEAGVRKRFLHLTPEIETQIEKDIRVFSRELCEKNFEALDSQSDTSIATWLRNGNYPLWRQEELLEKWKQCEGILLPKHYKVKSHAKDETYIKYAHIRWINSRTDEFKCKVGPIFRLIESVVFKNKVFIKKIPVKDRPAFLRESLERIGHNYGLGDYTAFEAHFVSKLMDAIEFELYRYMVSRLPKALSSFLSSRMPCSVIMFVPINF